MKRFFVLSILFFLIISGEKLAFSQNKTLLMVKKLNKKLELYLPRSPQIRKRLYNIDYNLKYPANSLDFWKLYQNGVLDTFEKNLNFSENDLRKIYELLNNTIENDSLSDAQLLQIDSIFSTQFLNMCKNIAFYVNNLDWLDSLYFPENEFPIPSFEGDSSETSLFAYLDICRIISDIRINSGLNDLIRYVVLDDTSHFKGVFQPGLYPGQKLKFRFSIDSINYIDGDILDFAIFKGRDKFIKIMADSGFGLEDKSYYSPLRLSISRPRLAILCQDTSFLNFYFQQKEEIPNEENFFAAAYGTPNILKFLIKKGLDVNKNICGYSLMHAALDAKNIQNVKLLLKHDINFNIKVKNIYDPYYDFNSCKLDLPDSTFYFKINGYSIFHAAARAGVLSVVKKCIIKKVPFEKDDKDFNPLDYAVQAKHDKIVRFLIDMGYVPNRKNDFCNKPEYCQYFFIRRPNQYIIRARPIITNRFIGLIDFPINWTNSSKNLLNLGFGFTSSNYSLLRLSPLVEGYYDFSLFEISMVNNLNRYRGLIQIGFIGNKVEDFQGGVQVGIYNGEPDVIYGVESFHGGVQVGMLNNTKTFQGGVQFGLISNDTKTFQGGVQVGMINNFFYNTTFQGGVQFGLISNYTKTFQGGMQVGGVNGAETFQGGVQVGFINGPDNETFQGGMQIGGFNGAKIFQGGAQIGLLPLFEQIHNRTRTMITHHYINSIKDLEAYDIINFITGINVVGKFYGFAQVGGINLSEYFKGFGQIGYINYSKYHTGIQIGVINYTNQLKGLQLGLINWINNRESRLIKFIPFFPIFNIGIKTTRRPPYVN